MTLFRQLIWLMLLLASGIQIVSSSTLLWQHKSQANALYQQKAIETAFLINNLLANMAKTTSLEDGFIEKAQALTQDVLPPLFDNQTFGKIQVTLDRNQTLFSQQLGQQESQVPDWFRIRFGFLRNIQETLQIVHGQELVVAVEMNLVQMNTNYYTLFSRSLSALSIGVLIGGLALFFILRHLLKPLSDLERYAHAIANRQFDQQLGLPPTKELAQVAWAMNQMSQRLNELFHEQHEIIREARELAFEDQLTQLPNALAFKNYLQMMFAPNESNCVGFVILAKVDGLDELNLDDGRAQGDENLLAFAKLWQQHFSTTLEHGFVARRFGSEFYAWAPFDNLQALDDHLHQVQKTFEHNQSTGNLHPSLHLVTSRLLCTPPQAAWAEITLELDELLVQAIKTKSLCLGKDNLLNNPGAEQLATNKTTTYDIPENEWNYFFPKTLAEKNLILVFQPVIHPDQQTTTFAECLTRVPYGDRILSGQSVWSILEKMQLTYAFDRLVILTALDHLEAFPHFRLSLNMSDSTLKNENFVHWFQHTMNNYPDLVSQLILEVKESFLNTANAIETLVHISNTGVKIYLDRVTADKNTIEHFVGLPIHGIKLNVDFLKQAEKNHQGQEVFIKSLLGLAKSCNVEIIVDGIESLADWNLALDAQVDGLQGYCISEPKETCENCFEIKPKLQKGL